MNAAALHGQQPARDAGRQPIGAEISWDPIHSRVTQSVGEAGRGRRIPERGGYKNQ